MFLVQVAADIFSNKLNLELAFAARPSIPELVRASETAFTNEIAQRRPAGVPVHSFLVTKFKIYDEDLSKWVDVRAESQLIDSCQCYAFQQENPWHKETQKEIPPAVRPSAYAHVPAYDKSSATGVGAPYQGGHNSSATAPVAQQSIPAAGAPYSASAAAAQQQPYQRQSTGGSQRHVSAGFTAVDATEDEKLRAVFAEFDIKNQRKLDPDDVSQGFRALGLNFSAATIRDLFQKGDYNQDGQISFSEFERFAKWYPIMMDCLFYRSRLLWEDKNMELEITNEKEAVRQAEALVAQAEQAQRAAKKAEDDARARVGESELDIRDKAQLQRDLALQAEQAARDRERAAKEKADREAEAIAARDRERQARQAQGEAQRDVEKNDRKFQTAAQEQQRADEKVRQLQAQLAEAQRQAERAAQVTRQAQQEVEAARNKERDAGKSAEGIARDIPRTDEQLRQAESTLAVIADRQRELELKARDAQRDQEEALRRRDTAERSVTTASEHERQMADEVARAKAKADERARIAKQREDDLLEQQAARQRVSADEQALIDQEIKLREQRESLESKESKLQSDASLFLGKMRASVSRGPSNVRDPSYSR